MKLLVMSTSSDILGKGLVNTAFTPMFVQSPLFELEHAMRRQHGKSGHPMVEAVAFLRRCSRMVPSGWYWLSGEPPVQPFPPLETYVEMVQPKRLVTSHCI